ncbi:M48 family metallopeptidase [Microbulbifer sp.]|uniref:M48 family metallopeptidase n=1 Tax=Microbulbifer sp. TaxID=1908541 RepID=UPI0025905663|nr:M48 family metallopeptidase [Microbulbifer sp.]
MNQTIVLHGKWQDGATSSVLPAELHCLEGRVYLIANGEELMGLPLDLVQITPKLGRTPRYLTFADQRGQFECEDHSGLDQLDKSIGSRGYGIIHRLENHLGMVVFATVLVAGIIWGYFTWGVPAASEALAYRLPADLLDRSAQETLSFMEEYSLEPTALSDERQAEIRAEFSAFAPSYPIEKLRFYRGAEQGANAFALPDGTIIFTDEIIALADTNDELLAVFGHELGHVAHRHSLRQVIQGSAVSLTFALITGEVSALGDLLLTAPVVFSQLSYSRQFELESDAHAVDMLRESGRSPEALATMLSKLYYSRTNCSEDCPANESEPGTDSAPAGESEMRKDKNENREDGSKWLRYLSTHPHLEERIAITKYKERESD